MTNTIERFSAHISINHTTVVKPTDSRQYARSGEVKPERTTESVDVTVRSSTLVGLKQKLSGIIELLDVEDLEPTE